MNDQQEMMQQILEEQRKQTEILKSIYDYLREDESREIRSAQLMTYAIHSPHELPWDEIGRTVLDI